MCASVENNWSSAAQDFNTGTADGRVQILDMWIHKDATKLLTTTPSSPLGIPTDEDSVEAAAPGASKLHPQQQGTSGTDSAAQNQIQTNSSTTKLTVRQSEAKPLSRKSLRLIKVDFDKYFRESIQKAGNDDLGYIISYT